MLSTSILRLLILSILTVLPMHILAAADVAEVVVLDVESVHVGAKRYAAKYEQLKKEIEEAQASLYAEVDTIEALTNQMQVTPESSPQHTELQEKIEVAKFKVNRAKKRIEEQLKVKRFALIKNTTEDVRAQLKAYCEEKGHKVVLSTLNGQLQSSNTEQLRQELNQLNALYGADSHNITDDFIGWLNARDGEAAVDGADGDQPEGADKEAAGGNGSADITPVE